jgi:hypothetical protein
MQAVQEKSRGAAVSAGMVAPENRDVLLWQVLSLRGLSLPEAVAGLKHKYPALNEGTARSWVKRPGKGGRPIPRMWADRLAKEFKQPRLRLPESWPNGIRD